MGYIPSNQIAVFPCGRRDDTIDPAARLTTEFNLVSIINRLVDQKSFVVPPSSDAIDENTVIEFNIGGYLFKTTVSDLDTASAIGNSGFIYGTINLQKWPSGDNFTAQSTYNFTAQSTYNFTAQSTYQDLDSFEQNSPTNLDTSGFTGLNVQSSTDYQDADTDKLTILYKDSTSSSATYTIPADSLIKFMTKGNNRSVTIDDGDLDD